jgi:hypothetical protein
MKLILLIMILFPSVCFAKNYKEDAEGDIVIEDTGTDAPEGYLEFTDETEATAKRDAIDKAFGFLVQDPDTLEWYRPYQTQHAYEIIKHPTENKWAISAKKISGTKKKKKGDIIFTKQEKDKFKSKKDLEDEGYFLEEDVIE